MSSCILYYFVLIHVSIKIKRLKKNHNEISSHLSEWLLSKRQDVVKREPLVHSWWECKLVQLLWKTVQRLLRPKDFNITEYKKFLAVISDSILKLTFKKLPLVEFWCHIKEYPQLPEKPIF